LQSGCDVANVQALAGHKSIKTTQRYLGTCTQLRREAVNRLNFPEAKADSASGAEGSA
jgi:site-specific recombinase XerD